MSLSVLESWHIAEESKMSYFSGYWRQGAVCVHVKTIFKMYFYEFPG